MRELHLISIPVNLWEQWPPDRSLAALAKDALGMERRIEKGVGEQLERIRYMQMCERIESLAMHLANLKRAKAHVILRENTSPLRHFLTIQATLSTKDKAWQPPKKPKPTPIYKSIRHPASKTIYKSVRHRPSLWQRIKSWILNFIEGIFFLRPRAKRSYSTNKRALSTNTKSAWETQSKRKHSTLEKNFSTDARATQNPKPQREVKSSRQRLHPYGKSFYTPGEAVRVQFQTYQKLKNSDLRTLDINEKDQAYIQAILKFEDFLKGAAQSNSAVIIVVTLS